MELEQQMVKCLVTIIGSGTVVSFAARSSRLDSIRMHGFVTEIADKICVYTCV